MSTSNEHQWSCYCVGTNADPDVVLLRELVTAGFDQVAVSHALWDDHPSWVVLSQPFIPRLTAARAVASIRVRLAALHPWLRLPLEVSR